jgi:hypothetical protein
MQWIIILTAIILFVPLIQLVLKSLKFLKRTPSSYYDFSVIFVDTKPWTVILYIGIIAVLGLIVFLVSGVGFIRLSA